MLDQNLHQFGLRQSDTADGQSQAMISLPPAKDGSAPESWLGGVHPDGFLEFSKGFYHASSKLIRNVHSKKYSPTRDVLPVPPPLLLAVVIIYSDRFQAGYTSIEIPTLVYAEHSPGRLMRESEAAICRSLDKLHVAGHLIIESKAKLVQVRFRSGLYWLEAMRLYNQEL